MTRYVSRITSNGHVQFVEVNEEIDQLPNGLTIRVTEHGGEFTLSQTIRLLLSQTIVTRPYVLNRRRPTEHHSVRPQSRLTAPLFEG